VELAVHDRFTECVGAGVPVPVSASVVVEDCALLVIVNVALAAAAVCGLNVIMNGVLCPDGIVTGRESPPTLKAELFVLAAVTVTLPPLALKLPEAVPLWPTTTSPNARVAGVTDNWPGCGAVPVPDSGIVRVGFEAFEATFTVPLALLAVCGLNATVKVAL
jgi:hypothetical protein